MLRKKRPVENESIVGGGGSVKREVKALKKGRSRRELSGSTFSRGGTGKHEKNTVIRKAAPSILGGGRGEDEGWLWGKGGAFSRREVPRRAVSPFLKGRTIVRST